MANAHKCRAGKHRFELVSGIGAGLQRQKCANCGSVMIDLTDDHELDLVAAGLFAARRSTVFSVPPTTEPGDDGFGHPRARR
jgi:hypothetical protein